jgi:GNAT superfamily N-acetyltransferase
VRTTLRFVIRPARPDDVPTIARLIRELASYEKLEHEVVGDEGDLREDLFGARPRAEVILAEEGDKAVGFALFFHNYSTFLARPGLYLEDLYVVPERRRQGWGRRLLVAVARIAAQRRCGRFEWTALHWNEPAIRFYQSLGAEMMDEWRIFRVTGGALARLAERPDA